MTPEEEQASKDRFIEQVLRAEKLQREVNRLWKENLKLKESETERIQVKHEMLLEKGEAQFHKRVSIFMWILASLIVLGCLDWSSCV